MRASIMPTCTCDHRPPRAVLTLRSFSLAAMALLDWHDHLADRPECYSGKLQMRPSEGNAYYGDGEEKCADILTARILGARNRLLAERKQRIGSNVERRPCPWQTDN